MTDRCSPRANEQTERFYPLDPYVSARSKAQSEAIQPITWCNNHPMRVEFDDHTLDTQTRELLGPGGELIGLEPQAFDV